MWCLGSQRVAAAVDQMGRIMLPVIVVFITPVHTYRTDSGYENIHLNAKSVCVCVFSGM